MAKQNQIPQKLPPASVIQSTRKTQRTEGGSFTRLKSSITITIPQDLVAEIYAIGEAERVEFVLSEKAKFEEIMKRMPKSGTSKKFVFTEPRFNRSEVMEKILRAGIAALKK